MKIILSERQFRNIVEADYNFHLSTRGSGFKDIKNIEPYGSDNIIIMRGRGTGHFGSGLYFSTYNMDFMSKTPWLDEYRVDDGKSEFTKVNGGVYRVDLDIYKNLYRVKYDNHGYYLFETLKLANQIFYRNTDFNGNGLKLSPTLSTDYLILKNNLDKLGLKVPRYRDFIRMMESAAYNLQDRKDRRSFSTRIMEYNGFNGVNVSGIPMFDNTLHGSVIYDMSKVSGDIVKVNDKIDYLTRMERGVIGSRIDRKVDILRGEEHFTKLDNEDKNHLIKRYPKFVKSYYLNNVFNEKELKMYYRFLQMKMKKGIMSEKPDSSHIDDMIEHGYSYIIYDPEIKIGDQTFLEYVLSDRYYIKDKNLRTLMDSVNRELSKDEKELYDMVREDLDWLN
jgi:hypothetical protein